ncbi:cholesterol oxidase substrate-binding domain-containing protein [Streptomyces thinghirensis]|uniref:Cholesterol oxidase substrate-binding domain-containing protein n=1 Tax=Streptomyces thinghirensis TaxID=551547 RepID=A0ABP9TEC8_9ACTN
MGPQGRGRRRSAPGVTSEEAAEIKRLRAENSELPDRPEVDTAVWIDVLSLPTTPALHRFYRDIEQFLQAMDGDRATVRVEWSKGWAYTDTAVWSDPDVLTRAVPAALRAGGGPGWDEAVAILNRLDPHQVVSSPFLDALLR